MEERKTRGRLFGGEGRLGSMPLRMGRGRRLLVRVSVYSFAAEGRMDLPLGFGDVSMVYKRFMLLMS